MDKKPYRVTVMGGDGIGPEVMKPTLEVLEATGVSFVWDKQLIGADAHFACGSYLPDDTLDSIARNGIAIKGPTATPVGEGHRSVNVLLREKFGLDLNVRPTSNSLIKNRFSDVKIDLMVFRMNLGDLYIGEERVTEERESFTAIVERDGSFALKYQSGETGADHSRLSPEVVEAIARFDAHQIRKFAQRAYEYARARGRKKVTIGHKANILKKSHGLFLRVCREVAKDFPEIEVSDLIADNLAMQLVMRPERFDCLLLPNFIGDLYSDLCAGLTGGLGFAAGANIGDKVAIFEAVHGTAPDIVGKELANPSALILSGAMMLEHLGERAAAYNVRRALAAVVHEGEFVTKDVNPKHGVSTDVFTRAIIERLDRI